MLKYGIDALNLLPRMSHSNPRSRKWNLSFGAGICERSVAQGVLNFGICKRVVWERGLSYIYHNPKSAIGLSENPASELPIQCQNFRYLAWARARSRFLPALELPVHRFRVVTSSTPELLVGYWNFRYAYPREPKLSIRPPELPVCLSKLPEYPFQRSKTLCKSTRTSSAVSKLPGLPFQRAKALSKATGTFGTLLEPLMRWNQGLLREFLKGILWAFLTFAMNVICIPLFSMTSLHSNIKKSLSMKLWV